MHCDLLSLMAKFEALQERFINGFRSLNTLLGSYKDDLAIIDLIVLTECELRHQISQSAIMNQAGFRDLPSARLSELDRPRTGGAPGHIVFVYSNMNFEYYAALFL
jgi:hypothetical protein